MKYLTKELTGAPLDLAVARAADEPVKVFWGEGCVPSLVLRKTKVSGGPFLFCPSSEWEDGGPIIEQERIELATSGFGRPEGFAGWTAWIGGTRDGAAWEKKQHGDTPLIAACRVFVAAKLGEEVDL